MKAAVFASLAVTVSSNAASVTPIQKVLEMMDKMKEKAMTEKKDEAVAFTAFHQWCDDTAREKSNFIEKTSNQIQELASNIDLAQTDIEAAAAKVAEVEEDMGRWEKDEKSATYVREKEYADYQVVHEDYLGTVDACDRAIKTIENAPGKIKQSFLEESAVALSHAMKIEDGPAASKSARQRIMSLMDEAQKGAAGLVDKIKEIRSEGSSADSQPNRERLTRGDTKANAYESQSAPILKMVKELKQRFVEEMTDLQKEEIDAKGAYDALRQRLQDQTEMAVQIKDQKVKFGATRKADKADFESEKADEERALKKAQDYLSEMNMLCTQKSTDFESRQKLREEEIEAISKAIEIIGGDAIHSEHLPSSAAAGAALVQLPSNSAPASTKPTAKFLQQRAAALLRQRASVLGSQTLAAAAKIAENDPFVKVRKMIQNLIVKLMEQANAEAETKGWCDTELGTNQLTRTNKAEEVDELHAEVERLTAEGAQLVQDLAALSEEIVQLDKAMATAAEERSEEKAANEATIADAKESQTAVANALAVLREFYAKAGEATALVQQSQSPADDAPATFDAPYKGQQGESTGVIGMLEVIESDFARLDVETESAEQAAAASYKEFVATSEEDKAVAEATVEHKTEKAATTKQLLHSSTTSLEQTQAELDAAVAYFEKLKPKCVASGIDAEERIKRREDEMQSLKEAYQILAGEAIPDLSELKAEQVGSA